MFVIPYEFKLLNTAFFAVYLFIARACLGKSAKVEITALHFLGATSVTSAWVFHVTFLLKVTYNYHLIDELGEKSVTFVIWRCLHVLLPRWLRKLTLHHRYSYGKPPRDTYQIKTPARRLELNLAVALLEKPGKPVTAPGIPPSYPDPQKLVTDDCIRP